MSRTSPTQLLNGAERPSLAPALQSMQDPALPALKLTLLSILFLSKMEEGAVGAPSKAVTKGKLAGLVPRLCFDTATVWDFVPRLELQLQKGNLL